MKDTIIFIVGLQTMSKLFIGFLVKGNILTSNHEFYGAKFMVFMEFNEFGIINYVRISGWR